MSTSTGKWWSIAGWLLLVIGVVSSSHFYFIATMIAFATASIHYAIERNQNA